MESSASKFQSVIMPLAVILGFVTLWRMSESGYADALQHGDGKHHVLLDEIVSKLEMYYDGPVDRTAMINGGLKGVASALGDPYTVLQPPIEAKRHQEQVGGEFGGIGVTIQGQSNGFLLVSQVRRDGPAHTVGVLAGDLIVAVDGQSLLGMELSASQSLVRGLVGTNVVLGIERDGERMDLTIPRQVIVVASVTGAHFADADEAIAYVAIGSFTERTGAQFRTAIEGLKLQREIKGLVIDLRGNGGGVLDAVRDITSMLTGESGRVVVRLMPSSEETRRRRDALGVPPTMVLDGETEVTRSGETLLDVPMAVLVDRDTASASEVLSGALQDWGVAFVVGETTFGKGLVQRPWRLESDPRYSLKITIAGYQTPLGNRLRQTGQNGTGGIRPDIEIVLNSDEQRMVRRRAAILENGVPTDPEADLAGEDLAAWRTEDRQLAAAVACLRGEPAVVRMRHSR